MNPPAYSQRASTLIVCPRCGFGNSLRVMATALHTAGQHNLRLAHLWRRDSPVGSPRLFEDEITGSRAVDFEALFQPIPECPPYETQGERIRLLYEANTQFHHRGLNIVEEVPTPCVAFQYQGPLTEAHLANVDAALALTSLNFPATPVEKVAIYQRHFKPLDCYLQILATQADLLGSRWLCVHLRTAVRTAFRIPEWNLEDLVRQADQLVRDIGFDRIIVFSDVPSVRAEFAMRRFGDVPVAVLDWPGQSSASRMFLDFLAISRATLILNSGVTSFSYEASLFGGGIPIIDMYRGLLVPTGGGA